MFESVPFGRRVGGEVHTPEVAGASCPNTDGCDRSCPEPTSHAFAALPNWFFLRPPCGALVLASPSFGFVGALGGAPFCFSFRFSFPFFSPLLVRCSRLKSRARALCGKPYWLKLANSVRHKLKLDLSAQQKRHQQPTRPSGPSPPTLFQTTLKLEW